MPTKQCADCNLPFQHKEEESYKTYCMPCFKKSKGWKLTASDNAYIDMQKEHASLLRKSEELETQNKRIKAKYRALAKKSVQETSKPTLPLKDLLRLCHPDRHQNSPLATRMTQWLLSQK